MPINRKLELLKVMKSDPSSSSYIAVLWTCMRSKSDQTNFLKVSLLQNNKVIGCIPMKSKEEDDFWGPTLTVMGQSRKTIQFLQANFCDSYDVVTIQ